MNNPQTSPAQGPDSGSPGPDDTGRESDRPLYTVAVPLYCEEDSLEELADRVEATFKGMGLGREDFEILFVDDGSVDGSRELLRRMSEERPYVRYLGFRTNQGKSLALTAAFDAALGEYVITMDADLQDNPEDIPKLVQEMEKGFDVVSGWRERRTDGFVRAWGSKLFNKTVGDMSGLKLHDFNCGFKIYRREVVKSVRVYGQFHRYIPVLAHAQGFKVGEIRVKNSERKYGSSKFKAIRFVGLFDLMSILFIKKYNFSPLHFFGKLSLLFFVPCGLALFFLITLHFLSVFGLGEELSNRPMLILSAVGMMIGFTVLLTGFICDLLLHHVVRSNLTGIIKGMVDEESGEKTESGRTREAK